MSPTSFQHDPPKPVAEPTTQPAPLDAAVAATPDRRQSITVATAAFLGVDPQKVCDLLRQVWTTTKGQPALTNAELLTGMALVSRYELDPFSREIYVTRDKKGRLMTILGIDGWIRVLDRTEHYDGFKQVLDRGPGDTLVSVETFIYSKTREHPAHYMAFMADYLKLGGFMAGQIPGHMLRIFSLRHAARLFVPLGGVVTPEEAQWMGATVDDTEPVNSLDELTKNLTGEQAKPEPDPAFDPPTEKEVNDADKGEAQARLADEYSQLLADSTSAGVLELLTEKIRDSRDRGDLASEQVAALQELIDVVKTRLSKME